MIRERRSVVVSTMRAISVGMGALADAVEKDEMEWVTEHEVDVRVPSFVLPSLMKELRRLLDDERALKDRAIDYALLAANDAGGES
jgi:hypothetical protein